MKKTSSIPNIITGFRILLTPVIVILLLQRSHYVIPAIIFTTIAALTDLFDGRIARKNGFGVMIDDVAAGFISILTFYLIKYFKNLL